MSKRIDKKKLKRQTETTPAAFTAPAAAPAVPVQSPARSDFEQVDFFIQYQDQEYLEKEILTRIKEKCEAEGKEVNGTEKLSVYLKPEDRKAYYTYAGISGSIDL